MRGKNDTRAEATDCAMECAESLILVPFQLIEIFEEAKHECSGMEADSELILQIS
jgi:hypothetical protein